MSGKLDQTLDEILSTSRRGGPRRSQRRSVGGRPTTAAPVGGIQKTTKPARASAAKPTPAKAAASGESKIIVSNLVRTCLLRRHTNIPLIQPSAQGCLGAADQGMFPLRLSSPRTLFDLFSLALGPLSSLPPLSVVLEDERR
jgi:hypothetical protein